MKLKSLTLLAIVYVMTSCMQSPQGERAKTGDASVISIPKNAEKVYADLSKSHIEWLGTKPTGTHYGTLSLKEGAIYVKDGKLLAGELVMDMNTIVVADITDPKMNSNLLNHLKSADFFLVDSFPIATFKFALVSPFTEDGDGDEPGQDKLIPSHRIEGNLTMRGITRKVNFPALIEFSDEAINAQTPQFIINRTEWNVNYGSKSIFANLKDNFIHDEIGIKISLYAKK